MYTQEVEIIILTLRPLRIIGNPQLKDLHFYNTYRKLVEVISEPYNLMYQQHQAPRWQFYKAYRGIPRSGGNYTFSY